MSNRYLYAALCGVAAALVAQPAHSHEIVGNRMFPATLAIDDPGVADELALPTVSMSKTGDVPPVKELDISGEYSKLITEDFAVSFSPTWTHLYAPGGPNMIGASGFQNIETTFKYRAVQERRARIRRLGRPQHRMGRQRRAGRRRRTASPPTRRRSISAKASAICPPA